MARIRTIKPDFFRDEQLQDIQAEHPELNPMLVFAGLWTVADKNGVFEWLPRTLKLDILPFLNYDLVASLLLLERFSMISRFDHNGKEYGVVVNFSKHQRISGKEAVSESKYPIPSQGSVGEAPEKPPGAQEGKGNGVQEGKGEGEFPQHPLNYARKVIELLGLSDRIIRSVESGIMAEINYSGADIETVCQQITTWCSEARKRGVVIDKFTFDDTKWRNGNGSKQQTPPAVERVNANRTVLADIGRERVAERVGPNGDQRESSDRAADRKRISASAG